MDINCNDTSKSQQCHKGPNSIRRQSAEVNKDRSSRASKASMNEGVPKARGPAQKGARKPKLTVVSENATLSGAIEPEQENSPLEHAPPDCGKLPTIASVAAPVASAGKKKRVSFQSNIECGSGYEESSSKAGQPSESDSVDDQQPPSDTHLQSQTAGSGRSAARQRAAEKRNAIRCDLVERRSRKKAAATSPTSIAATILYRPADRTASFRLLPRRVIVEALEEMCGVTAVRVNFQRNVVAVDVADRSDIKTLLAMDSVNGLRIVGRECAARPGVSSGVIYTDLEGRGKEDIVSCLPLVNVHPSRSGRSALLRFDGTPHPPYVYFDWLRAAVCPNRPRPLQCNNCGRFNHAAASCQHPTRCMRCGKSGGHSQSPCEAAAKCGNCNGPHSMTDYCCRVWKQERRVEAALATGQVTSRREARAAVRAACSDLESRRSKKRRCAKQALLLKQKHAVQPGQVQVAIGETNKKAELPNALPPSPRCSLPQPTGAQRAKASEKTTSILLHKSNGAGDAGPKGKHSGNAQVSGKGTVSGATGHAFGMAFKLPPGRQHSTSAEWASIPQGIPCPVTKTKGATSKTAAAAPHHARSAASAAANGVSSCSTGTSTEVTAAPRDQEEAYYSVLAQLATALQRYYSQLSPPVAESSTKKKNGGKKRW